MAGVCSKNFSEGDATVGFPKNKQENKRSVGCFRVAPEIASRKLRQARHFWYSSGACISALHLFGPPSRHEPPDCAYFSTGILTRARVCRLVCVCVKS